VSAEKLPGKLRHGLSYTPEYRAWQTMRHRCTERTSPAWADYGGRGITICARWLNSPANFLADVGPRPSKRHEIDRRDNGGGYWCGHCTECRALGREANCRWVTRSTNNRNRRSNRHLVYRGETAVLRELAETFSLAETTLRDRLDAGWDIERALTTPAKTPPKSRRTEPLTDDDVRDIRARRSGGEPIKSVAERYLLSEATVSNITNRKAYRHVA
jgi:hypothetical protein